MRGEDVSWSASCRRERVFPNTHATPMPRMTVKACVLATTALEQSGWRALSVALGYRRAYSPKDVFLRRRLLCVAEFCEGSRLTY